MKSFPKWHDWIAPVAVAACLMVVLVPLPAALLDMLLAANLTAAVMILLTTLRVRRPLDFSTFPTLLLAATVARLALNLASTRLILTEGETQALSAAGGVIRSFGEFVAGDRLIVGLVMFAILLVVQFVVITKGAARVSEVAARFASDGLPGRQMAIDADLAAGLIDKETARRRRSELAAQADFYGAMDGASKFARGDAVAGLVITGVNIVGGMLTGLLAAGMSWSEALGIYAKLAIGDGLVTQIPAVLIALSAGFLVTRSGARRDLTKDVAGQILSRTEVLAGAAALFVVLAACGLPKPPLLTLAGICGLAAVFGPGRRPAKKRSQTPAPQTSGDAPPAATGGQTTEEWTVHPLELELGVGLVTLADAQRGGDLVRRLGGARRELARQWGLMLPSVRIVTAASLPRNGYQVRIAGNAVAAGKLPKAPLAWIPEGVELPASVLESCGPPREHPGFDVPLRTIRPADRAAVVAVGGRVLEPAAALTQHFQRVATQFADELLSRETVAAMVQQQHTHTPTLIDELIPEPISLGLLHQVLQALLREQVPIHQLDAVLEALAEDPTSDRATLVERTRRRLARTICSQHRDGDGKLWYVALSADLERRLAEGELDASLALELPQQLSAEIEASGQATSGRVVLLTSPAHRRVVRQWTWSAGLEMPVMSYEEVTRDTQLQRLGTVGPAAQLAAA